MTQIKSNIPKIRFKEFSWEWEAQEFWDFAKKNKWKYNPKDNNNVYECIELESIEQNTWLLLETFDSTELKSIKSKFNKWDVLYSKLRPYLNKYYYAKIDWVCSSEIWVFNWIGVKNLFLYYIIQISKFSQIANISFGSKMPRSDWNYVSSIPFNLPQLPEQQKIAWFLSLVDEKIENIKEKKKSFEEYKKGVMQKIFRNWNEGNTGPCSLRFKDENWGGFGEWEEKKLEELIEYKNWGSFENNVVENWEFNLITLNSIDINWKIKDFHKKVNITDNSLIKWDLIMVLSDVAHWNFLWLTDIIPWDNYVLNQRIWALKPKIDLNRFFLKTLINFNQKYFKLHWQGSSQQILSKGDILKFIVSFPSLPEQQKIADFLSGIDEKIEKVDEELAEIEEFKKGLLQGMFV